MELRDLRPGEALSARWLNALARLLLRAAFAVAPPLELTRAGRRWVLRVALPERFPARITGYSAGAYAWQRIRPEAGGTWADVANVLGTTGADPAYEFNGNATVVVGTRVELIRGPDGSVRFQHATC